MKQDAAQDGVWPGWRIAAWAAIPAALLVPLIAMQFTTEVAWTAGDFVFAAAVLIAAGTTLELAARQSRSLGFRVAVVLAVVAAVLLVWVSGAVGIIGAEHDPANRLYLGVLAIGFLGALAARFRPAGLALAMLAAGLAQAAIGAVALGAGWGSSGPAWPFDVLIATLGFTGLWLGSAWLFQRAAA